MFDKKIILLLSLLLIAGWSHIFFHYIESNYDEVNFVDNSDSSINEDNIDTKKSISSLLFVIIVIVIIIAIFFYRKDKKNNKNNKETKFFEEYKQFKEVEANKQKIADGTKNEVIKEIVKFFEKAASDEYDELKKHGSIEEEDYDPDRYVIDFYYPFTNRELKNPYKEGDLIVYRFNNRENQRFFNEILFKFFAVIAEGKEGVYKDIYKEYKNDTFNNKEEKDKKEIMFFFIATIIEPFFKAMQERTYNNFVYIFLTLYEDVNFLMNPPIERPFYLISPFIQMQSSLSKDKKNIIKEIYEFFNYVLKTNRFIMIFNKIIESYFPSFPAPESKINYVHY